MKTLTSFVDRIKNSGLSAPFLFLSLLGFRFQVISEFDFDIHKAIHGGLFLGFLYDAEEFL